MNGSHFNSKLCFDPVPMAPKPKPISELGTVQKCNGDFRARMQRRTETGFYEGIYGPRRKKKDSAEDDLEELRAAGEKAGPDKAWKAMSDKSHRLQVRVHGKPAPPKVKRAAPRARRTKLAKAEPFQRGV